MHGAKAKHALRETAAGANDECSSGDAAPEQEGNTAASWGAAPPRRKPAASLAILKKSVMLKSLTLQRPACPGPCRAFSLPMAVAATLRSLPWPARSHDPWIQSL